MLGLLLHLGQPVTWTAWTLPPPVVSGTFITVSIYIYAVMHDESPIDWPRLASFMAGVGAIFIALASPLDAAAARLLSMHMLQHVLLTTIGPPLLLLGLPPKLMHQLLGPEHINPRVRLLANPVVPATLFIVNMWVWHVPPVYEAALYHPHLHEFEHLTFIVTGILYWWPVIEPLPQLMKMSGGARVLYLFATGFPMGLLALLLISSSTVVYGYYAVPPQLWGIPPLQDQQVAGVIMGALGEIAGFVAITLLFFRLLDQGEAAELERTTRPADA